MSKRTRSRTGIEAKRRRARIQRRRDWRYFLVRDGVTSLEVRDWDGAVVRQLAVGDRLAGMPRGFAVVGTAVGCPSTLILLDLATRPVVAPPMTPSRPLFSDDVTAAAIVADAITCTIGVASPKA